jgi:hypothetical protein
MYSMALVLPLFVVGVIFSSTIVFVCIGCWLLQMCGVSMLLLQIRAARRGTSR